MRVHPTYHITLPPIAITMDGVFLITVMYLPAMAQQLAALNGIAHSQVLFYSVIQPNYWLPFLLLLKPFFMKML